MHRSEEKIFMYFIEVRQFFFSEIKTVNSALLLVPGSDVCSVGELGGSWTWCLVQVPGAGLGFDFPLPVLHFGGYAAVVCVPGTIRLGDLNSLWVDVQGLLLCCGNWAVW